MNPREFLLLTLSLVLAVLLCQDLMRSFQQALFHRGYTCYLDVDDLASNVDGLSGLLNSVAACNTFLFFMSQHIFESTWCLKEIIQVRRRNATAYSVLASKDIGYLNHSTLRPCSLLCCFSMCLRLCVIVVVSCSSLAPAACGYLPTARCQRFLRFTFRNTS
jgi:hypothetical protein